MKTPGWLTVAVALAVIGTSGAGCATRKAASDVRSSSMVLRDVPDEQRQFPYGPAPFLARPAPDLR
jgi:hypothetical protein